MSGLKGLVGEIVGLELGAVVGFFDGDTVDTSVDTPEEEALGAAVTNSVGDAVGAVSYTHLTLPTKA